MPGGIRQQRAVGDASGGSVGYIRRTGAGCRGTVDIVSQVIDGVMPDDAVLYRAAEHSASIPHRGVAGNRAMIQCCAIASAAAIVGSV